MRFAPNRIGHIVTTRTTGHTTQRINIISDKIFEFMINMYKNHNVVLNISCCDGYVKQGNPRFVPALQKELFESQARFLLLFWAIGIKIIIHSGLPGISRPKMSERIW